MQSNWMPTVVKRSETGPFIKEPDFERALSKRTAELVKYGLIQPQTSFPLMMTWLTGCTRPVWTCLTWRLQPVNRAPRLFSRDEVEELVVWHRAACAGAGDAVVMAPGGGRSHPGGDACCPTDAVRNTTRLSSELCRNCWWICWRRVGSTTGNPIIRDASSTAHGGMRWWHVMPGKSGDPGCTSVMGCAAHPPGKMAAATGIRFTTIGCLSVSQMVEMKTS
jgi:hypothetical protein